jgi:hypothetical protein
MDTETAVSASVVVEAAIDHAFKVFIEDIASWWHPSTTCWRPSWPTWSSSRG